MLIKIGLVILVAIAGVLIYAGLQSPDYEIKREIAINAPAEKIFPFLNNSKNAEKWNPFLLEDPEAKMTYSGPDDGVGSKSSWDSEGKLGVGSCTITESIPHEKVAFKLEYTKPMVMTQEGDYSIRSSGNQSIVSWRVYGKNTFIGRVFCLFMNMDKMVGGSFEKGLSTLKGLVEAPTT